MDCKHVNEHLVDYLYQELDADQADRIEGHLRQCDGCAEDLAAFESTRRLMQQLPQLEPAGSVLDSLVREAERAIQPPTPGLWERLRAGLAMLVMHPAMTAAVALVLVLGVSFYAYRRTSPPPRGPRVDLPEVEDGLAAAPEPAGSAKVGTSVPSPVSPVTLAKKQPPAEPSPTVARAPLPEAGKTGAGNAAAPRRTLRARRPKMHARPSPPVVAKPAPAPRPVADALDGIASNAWRTKDDNAQGSKALDRKKRPNKTKAAAEQPVDRAAPWLAKARMANKKGDCDQALRFYHRALEIEPALRRLLGPEVRRCARVVAARGGARLERAQQDLPLLAGWLEAEISEVRRAEQKQQEQQKKAPPARAPRAKPVQASPYSK